MLLTAASASYAAEADAPWIQAKSETFRGLIERAFFHTQHAVLATPVCRDYFRAQGSDPSAWLSPAVRPRIVERSLRSFLPKDRTKVCGGTQLTPRGATIFVNRDCFRRADLDQLASLLLHEMGHVARRDTFDHEPVDFFRACRISNSLDPGSYR